jgi:hypothetical protein
VGDAQTILVGILADGNDQDQPISLLLNLDGTAGFPRLNDQVGAKAEDGL